MKALTILQPWASLIAVGAKKLETRDWATRYRGRLAIHAGKALTRDACDAFWKQAFRDALWSHYGEPGQLPVGQVIATVDLVDVVAIVKPDRAYYESADLWLPPASPERDFGDFRRGRFAWVLANPQLVLPRVPITGKLGLWDWEESVA